MRLLLFLISILVPLLAFGDDFIHMESQRVWKVQQCDLVGDHYRVKPCFTELFCETEYPKDQYSCLRSNACEESYLALLGKKSTRFRLVRKDKGVFFFERRDAPEEGKVAIIAKSERQTIDSWDELSNAVVLDAKSGKASVENQKIAADFVGDASSCPK